MVLSDQLTEFFENICHDYLCAFMKGHGCQTTLLRLRSLFWLGTSISIKSDGLKLVLRVQASPLSEMKRSCKCFPDASKCQSSYITGQTAIIKNAIILNIIHKRFI